MSRDNMKNNDVNASEQDIQFRIQGATINKTYSFERRRRQGGKGPFTAVPNTSRSLKLFWNYARRHKGIGGSDTARDNATPCEMPPQGLGDLPWTTAYGTRYSSSYSFLRKDV